LICSRKEDRFTLEFDIAIMCLGFRSEDRDVDALKEYYHAKNVEFINIGDSSRPRKIGYGVIEGRSILSSSTMMRKLVWR
jgi:hypothetical protein